MSKHEFEAVGDREKAGYQFNLEFSQGKVINNISGSAVARDLRDIIYSDSFAKELIFGGSYKIKTLRPRRSRFNKTSNVVHT